MCGFAVVPSAGRAVAVVVHGLGNQLSPQKPAPTIETGRFP